MHLPEESLAARSPRPTSRLLAVVIALGAVAGSARPHADAVEEARLQAAFVAKFPAFVHWPPAAFEGRGELTICVFRSERAATHLRELVAGEQVSGRSVSVRDVSTPAQCDGCHVLFVPGRDDSGVLATLGTRPVLTIGTERDFLHAGGIIALHRDDRRVRFEVHRDAAARAGLQLSSQLLRLAVAVHGGPR